jgi:hypothetical protein
VRSLDGSVRHQRRAVAWGPARSASRSCRPFDAVTPRIAISSLPLMPSRPHGLPAIERRQSPLHGHGVFAAAPINKNTRIIDYAGELVRNGPELDEREAEYLKQGCIWVFRVNRAWSRDANVDGNIARFINHSCRPNCYFQVVDKTIWIRAARNIRRGEELTYDYRTIGDKTIQCRCRPGCPNKL